LVSFTVRVAGGVNDLQRDRRGHLLALLDGRLDRLERGGGGFLAARGLSFSVSVRPAGIYGRDQCERG
jgi:hypothetical protein